MAHMTNPLATPEQLFQRRSFGALPMDLQDAVFFATQCLTQAAGILLELPQSITAQANVLLARYWLVEPMMSHEFSDVSAAILYLTAKCSDLPRSPRDLCLVYTHLLSRTSSTFFRPAHLPPPPPPLSPSNQPPTQADYAAFHARLLPLEAHILASLSFNTHVALPHPLAVTYLQALDFFGQPRRGPLARRALAYLNTALLSPQLLYLTSQPHALAVAALYNAARDVGARMPACDWWEVFDVEREELGFLVVGMRSVDGWGRKIRAEAIEGWEGAW
ncbi:afba626c-1865-4790-817d-50ad8dc1546f [Thermothielavioides terrestris]|uniref:Afba626c-1865-4790-817d-50ad8dc1546f n=1 Tax=Thermothielavioides terrestris TaxID=2587410 RepID=A0A3S4C9Z4_9PEZI|nr:afba626c-1865-4790-817d-50ad8dc1546f [Thermothielavioides terrestris]